MLIYLSFVAKVIVIHYKCNNMTFKVESSRSQSHVTITINPFNFYCNASSNLALIWSLGFLFNLCTCLFALCTQSLIIYVTEWTGHLCGIFHSGIICRLFTYRGIRLDHLRTSLGGKEQPVGWTQPNLFFCAVVSFVISIDQVYWLDDGGWTPAS